VLITQSGMPDPSTTTWRFVPAFPLSLSDSLRLFVPPFSGDTRRVEADALPIYLLCLSKTIQEDWMQLLPYSGLVPLA